MSCPRERLSHPSPMTPLDHARQHLKTAKANLARYKTLLVKAEAHEEELRALANSTGVSQSGATQAYWITERRMKSVARFESEVAEFQRRLALAEKGVDTTPSP